MALCCKHGTSKYAGTEGIEVYKSDPNWKKYKEYFKDDNDEACVPYEVIHGEPWKADHMEYWYEICFMIFEGNPYDRDDLYKFEKWGRYSGPEGGANSFEEMLIKGGYDRVAKAYILYRHQHNTLRNVKSIMEDTEMIDKYLDIFL
jgi:hypothetical protein